jgi:anti-anti-sigma factor
MVLIGAGRQPVSVTETAVGREVTICGRLDVDSVAEVRAALHEILDRGAGDLLVHLAQAEVHDATGLGVIVGIHHRARRLGRRLVLVDVSPRLDRLLRASRLHRVLARGPGVNEVSQVPPGPPVAICPPAVPASAEIVAVDTQASSPSTETVSPTTA